MENTTDATGDGGGVVSIMMGDFGGAYPPRLSTTLGG